MREETQNSGRLDRFFKYTGIYALGDITIKPTTAFVTPL